jgi:hypothetical protein
MSFDLNLVDPISNYFCWHTLAEMTGSYAIKLVALIL